MAINSRNKGQKAERKIAKLLEGWTGKTFTRTPSSGGLRWHRTKDTGGDIVCTTEGHIFPFVIEVKSHKEIDFSHLFYLKNTKIHEFWAQVVSDSTRCQKLPLLLMRYNGLPSDLFFVVIARVDFNEVFDECPIERYAAYSFEELDVVVMTSTDLFQLPYKHLKLKSKSWLKRKFKNS